MAVDSPSTPQTYSANEPITYEGMRKVLGGNGSGTLDGLFAIGLSIAAKKGGEIATDELLLNDIETLRDSNASKKDKGIALFSLTPMGKLKKIAEGIEEGKDLVEYIIEAQKKAEKAKDTAKDAKKSVEDVEIETKVTGKFISNADDVVFKQSSIDKAFSKHRNDFGSYPDGNKSSVELFKNDVPELINTGVQKQGKYRNVEGTHIYNGNNKLWTFINSDGPMNTAFKLSDSQYKYLIKKGVVK